MVTANITMILSMEWKKEIQATQALDKPLDSFAAALFSSVA
tara:strand:+ start:243 stop:365 length:123 start_codon:yes stop_codon:yes gene_type:complete